MNYHGNGVPQSYSEALAWFQKAADQGDAKSEYDVGYLYSRGLGVPKDRDEANRWYRKAASQGDEDAQLVLGLRLPPLKQRVWTVQAVLALGCILLTWDYLSPRRIFHDRKNRRLAVGGALAFLNIGMYLFSHSEYCLFPSSWAATAYRVADMFLGGIVVTLLVTASKPRSGKLLLVSSGILFVVLNLALCAVARFNLETLSAAYGRFIVLDSFPLGTVIAVAIDLWRKKREPADSGSEPPAETSETPDAV
jgi:hypothetical protein